MFQSVYYSLIIIVYSNNIFINGLVTIYMEQGRATAQQPKYPQAGLPHIMEYLEFDCWFFQSGKRQGIQVQIVERMREHGKNSMTA